MNEKKIKRINELYKKSKTTGLTETELEEQKTLRTEYRMAMLNSLSASLDNVSIKNPDGSITKVKPKREN
ncbi:MAG: DUF896 domain-containing protein [Eubacterium sp.]|jgi:uncharacterized protein YnzC (UPF0291/DUF896 family)|nr:DUF896 domain-containing protein [Eubacterium sp.]